MLAHPRALRLVALVALGAPVGCGAEGGGGGAAAGGSASTGGSAGAGGAAGAGGSGGGAGGAETGGSAGSAGAGGASGTAGAGATGGSAGAAGSAGSGAGGASGSGGAAGAGGSAGSPALWDHALLRDVPDASCQYANRRTVVEGLALVEVEDVTYRSYEVIDGTLRPIRVRAFLARPAGVSALTPGVVVAHGLGGAADPGAATGVAARLGVAALAYTGPGGGSATSTPPNDSEGRPSSYDSGRRMFDTVPDVRGSWFWGHAVAAMRGLTCLGARVDVDPTRLGITGFSAGGVVSHIAAGVDDRVKAAVPLSGTLAWDVATQAPEAWQHELLRAAGYTTADEHWTRLMAAIVEPTVTLASTAGRVLMVNGTSDEFFPLTAHLATFDALPGAQHRMALAAHFDHGCFPLVGPEAPATIEARAAARADGAQLFWFGHTFGRSEYATVPAMPTHAVTVQGGLTLVAAQVDAAGYDVTSVTYWASTDGNRVFGSVPLDATGGGLWSALVPLAVDPTAVVGFVDVEYRTRALIPQRFYLASRPTLPAGFVPSIRRMGDCQ